jgi:glutaredoxin
MNQTPLEVVLYTRIGCHLCNEAQLLLEKYGLAVRTIDIDRNPELAAQYDQCVPVIVIDGRERFRGRVDEVLLRRLLRQRPD